MAINNNINDKKTITTTIKNMLCNIKHVHYQTKSKLNHHKKQKRKKSTHKEKMAINNNIKGKKTITTTRSMSCNFKHVHFQTQASQVIIRNDKIIHQHAKTKWQSTTIPRRRRQQPPPQRTCFAASNMSVLKQKLCKERDHHNNTDLIDFYYDMDSHVLQYQACLFSNKNKLGHYKKQQRKTSTHKEKMAINNNIEKKKKTTTTTRNVFCNIKHIRFQTQAS